MASQEAPRYESALPTPSRLEHLPTHEDAESLPDRRCQLLGSCRFHLEQRVKTGNPGRQRQLAVDTCSALPRKILCAGQ